ncbi:hypothetical protein ACJBQW_11225, partial [Streptococcus suis]
TSLFTLLFLFQNHLLNDYLAEDFAFSVSIGYVFDRSIWLNAYFDREYYSEVLFSYEFSYFIGGTLCFLGSSYNLIASVEADLD